MRPYPKLSEEAYEDDSVHLAESIEMVTEIASHVWTYYRGKDLTEKQYERLLEAIKSALSFPITEAVTSSVKSTKTVEGKVLEKKDTSVYGTKDYDLSDCQYKDYYG